MDRHPLLQVVIHLANARRAIDAEFNATPRVWPVSVEDQADSVLKHSDQALDAAIVLALGSGVTIADIELSAGIPVTRPEWFED